MPSRGRRLEGGKQVHRALSILIECSVPTLFFPQNKAVLSLTQHVDWALLVRTEDQALDDWIEVEPSHFLQFFDDHGS